MTDVAAFVAARLDEDEAAAHDAGFSDAERTWIARNPYSDAGEVRDANGDPVVYDEGSPSAAEAAHIARHDPARVLREVAAGRRVLERHCGCGSGAGYCDDGGHGGSRGCADMTDLAWRWSDHPDYDQEWER